MALLLSPADHSQWRMKLNNFPYFPTRNAEGFGAAKAFKPVPSTGKPDPALIEAFLKEYPEARKSIEQKAKMPLTGSFSGAEFYVVNAFILRASNGQEQPVRWSMRPHSKFISLTKEQRDQADHDFLFKDIKNVWLKGRSIGTWFCNLPSRETQ